MQVWRISYIKEGKIGEANHDRFQRRGLKRGFSGGLGGVSERSGDMVFVPADALVYDRVFEAAFVLVETG